MERHDENSQVTVALPEELQDRLQKEADKQQRTLNGYIVWLLANRPRKEKME